MPKEKFNVNALLNQQSTAVSPAPAGRLRVVMLPRGDLRSNPENQIYIIGDVGTLAEDIAANGIRQPLEVIPAEGNTYMLLSGHRRLAACEQLAAHGDKRFELLPCVVRQSEGTAADKLALITANATARELTDGERLDQYIAMKDALTELKKEGKLEGRVRDEMARRLGESSGGLARLNAIAANCTDEVRQMIRDGKCGFIRAYEASRLPARKQAAFAETGKVPPTPGLTQEQKEAVTKWMLTDSPAVKHLKAVDYENTGDWSFMRGQSDYGCRGIVGLPGGLNAIVGDQGSYVTVSVPDPADESQELHHGTITWRELYDRAKRRYMDKARAEALKRQQEAKKAAEAEKRERIKQFDAKAKAVTEWPEREDIGHDLVIYKHPMPDGGKLWALTSPIGNYSLPFYRRYSANGTPIPLAPNRAIGWENYLPWDMRDYYADALLGPADEVNHAAAPEKE